MFSVSITHHLKIKELSEKNKNWKQLKTKSKQASSHGSYYFWVMSYGNRVMSYENQKYKHPLSILNLSMTKGDCLGIVCVLLFCN